MPALSQPAPGDDLQTAYSALRTQATARAGRPSDLERRARLYRQLYRHSGGNHGFPLLAAHGSLWARGYFKLAEQAARVLSLGHLGAPELRQRRLSDVATLIAALSDINRRVFLEIDAHYAFTAAFGEDAGAELIIDLDLLDSMNRCHAARRLGRTLTAAERRSIFDSFIQWEQTHVVSAAVDAAVSAFDWPLVRALALRPRVAFSFMSFFQQLQFKNFASRDERIVRGLQAFDVAERVGWDIAEAGLEYYGNEPAAPRGCFMRNCATTA
jgi:hypothetical protein